MILNAGSLHWSIEWLIGFHDLFTGLSFLKRQVQADDFNSASLGFCSRVWIPETEGQIEDSSCQLSNHLGQSGYRLTQIDHSGSVRLFRNHSFGGAGAGFTAGLGFFAGRETPMHIIRNPSPLRTESSMLIDPFSPIQARPVLLICCDGCKLSDGAGGSAVFQPPENRLRLRGLQARIGIPSQSTTLHLRLRRDRRRGPGLLALQNLHSSRRQRLVRIRQ